MPEDDVKTLGDLAIEVRSKNAGPFWITIEAFMRDAHGYQAADELITSQLIADLYAVPPGDIQIYRIPGLKVVKVSFPRTVSQASLHDRDIHAGQHHVLLMREPVRARDRTAREAR